MSKMKSIIKHNNKSIIASWILEKFPEGYQNLRYIEPFVGNGSILLNKDKSIEEVAGDSDLNIINLWKVIKDESKVLKKRLSKTRYSEKVFNEIKKLNDKEYSKQAATEISLRRMSKSDNKETFDQLDRKKANQNWKQLVDSIDLISDRVSSVYFLNIKPIEIISKFDNEKTFCFCSPPNSENSGDFIDICSQLKSFRGKAMFCAENSTVYRRLFSEWKCIKNKNKKHVIWCNF